VDKRSRYITESVINGLSDHDAQILKLIDLTPLTDNSKPIPTRNINEQSVTKLLSLLSWELWEEVFEENNKNVNKNVISSENYESNQRPGYFVMMYHF
jgi:hypothetical protein